MAGTRTETREEVDALCAAVSDGNARNLSQRGWRKATGYYRSGYAAVMVVARGGANRLTVADRRHEYSAGAWDDHGRLYYRKRDGRTEWMYVTEPYGLGAKALEDLMQLAQEHALKFWVNPWAVHNPLGCLSIWIVAEGCEF
jgi:hypothetical protein